VLASFERFGEQLDFLVFRLAILHWVLSCFVLFVASVTCNESPVGYVFLCGRRCAVLYGVSGLRELCSVHVLCLCSHSNGVLSC